MDDQDLLKLGKKVHNLFPKSRYETAMYGVGWEDGGIKALSNHACHMELMKQNRYSGGYKQIALDSSKKGPVLITNQVQSKYNNEGKILSKKDREKFFSFLFTDSVFANCYITQDPGKCEEDGISVRTDLPANLVVAACIATRQAWEYPDIGRTVLRLIKFGVEPRKAHLAAHSIKVEADGNYQNSYRGSHIAVYSENMGKKAVLNFLSGTLCDKIILNLSTYREARDYREIPVMWGAETRNLFKITRNYRPAPSQSDPFKFIKQVGEIQKMDVVEAVEQAFERILK